MAAREYTGDRKRSRPVTKRSKMAVFKKYKLVTIFVLLIIVIVAITSIYVVYTGDNDIERLAVCLYAEKYFERVTDIDPI